MKAEIPSQFPLLCRAGQGENHNGIYPEGVLGWIVIPWIKHPGFCWGDSCVLWLWRNFLRPLLFPAFSNGTGSQELIQHKENPTPDTLQSQFSEQVIPLGMKANRICGACPSQSCRSQPWQSRAAPRECRAGILTVEGNGCLVVLSLLCLLQVQQGGGKQGVVDEVFHVVLLTLLLGFGAHLVGHVLPATGRGGGFV